MSTRYFLGGSKHDSLGGSYPIPLQRATVASSFLFQRCRIGLTTSNQLSVVCWNRRGRLTKSSLWFLGFRIGSKRMYVVPGYLKKIPRVRILRCQQDWGPATKFIPVIQEELAAGRGKTLIMAVDDDRIYPRDALETYLHYHAQLPDAALCFRGALIPHSLVWFLPKMIRANQIREPKPVAVITGTASYLVQPQFFDSALWDYAGAPKSAFYMDDIWISGCLDRRGIKKYVVPASAMMRAVLAQRGTMTLCEVPNGAVRSNTEVINFFRDSWTVFFSRWTLSLPIIQLWIRSFLPSQAGIKSRNTSSVPKRGPAAAETGK